MHRTPTDRGELAELEQEARFRAHQARHRAKAERQAANACEEELDQIEARLREWETLGGTSPEYPLLSLGAQELKSEMLCALLRAYAYELSADEFVETADALHECIAATRVAA